MSRMTVKSILSAPRPLDMYLLESQLPPGKYVYCPRTKRVRDSLGRFMSVSRIHNLRTRPVRGKVGQRVVTKKEAYEKRFSNPRLAQMKKTSVRRNHELGRGKREEGIDLQYLSQNQAVG